MNPMSVRLIGLNDGLSGTGSLFDQGQLPSIQYEDNPEKKTAEQRVMEIEKSIENIRLSIMLLKKQAKNPSTHLFKKTTSKDSMEIQQQKRVKAERDAVIETLRQANLNSKEKQLG